VPRGSIRRFYRLYDAGAPFVWHSYAVPSYLEDVIGSQFADVHKILHLGAVMKQQTEENDRNPYSPSMCILLLLAFGTATQLEVLASWF
jgi:hypothetical protein